jgi:hypothetical protein
MTRGQKKRIDILELSAGPDAIASMWLEDIGQFHTAGDYFSWLLDDWQNRAPAMRLFRQAAAESVRVRGRRAAVALLSKTSRVVRDLTVLQTVVWLLNSEVEEAIGRAQSRIDGALLAVHLLSLVLNCPDGTPVNRASESSDSGPMATVSATSVPDLTVLESATETRAQIVSALTDLNAGAIAARDISESSFECRAVLFKSIALALDEARIRAAACSDEFERISGAMNRKDCCAQKLNELAEIDLGKIGAAAQQQAKKLVVKLYGSADALTRSSLDNHYKPEINRS